MKIAMADLISNSFFPVVAAAELGYFAEEGLDATIVGLEPVSKGFTALRDGEVDFVAGPAHGVLLAFPEWKGAKLVAAIAQGMSWLLVMRSDLEAKRGDLSCLQGQRIAAGQGPELGLRTLLEDAGVDLAAAGIEIVPVPGSGTPGFATGVAAVRALQEGKVDGFWANAASAELAVRRGVGTVVLDIRRGDGPPAAFHYTMPCLVATERTIETSPDTVSAVITAMVKAQRALKLDVRLAAEVGAKVFPAEEASLIADVVERDVPYYDATITETAVEGINKFARRAGLLNREVSYHDVVATRFSDLWSGNSGT